MDPAVIAAIIAGLAGAGLKYILERVVRGRTKTILAKSPTEATETVTVDVDATNQDIVNAVNRAIQLETEVGKALERVSASRQDTNNHPGRIVDFITQVGQNKVAIEVKNRLDRLDEKQLLRYLREEDGIQKVLVLSPDLATQRVRNKVKTLADAGEVEFIQIPEGAGQSERVSAILKTHLSLIGAAQESRAGGI